MEVFLWVVGIIVLMGFYGYCWLGAAATKQAAEEEEAQLQRELLAKEIAKAIKNNDR